MKRNIMLSILAASIFVCRPTLAQVNAAPLQAQLLGCWDKYVSPERHRENTANDVLEAYLVCFREDGHVTGVTFDANDGWEWGFRYKIDTNMVYFGQLHWGKVVAITPYRLTVEMKEGRVDFDFLCHSIRENAQCERLEYDLTRAR
jgi:hypothetical protein